MENDEWATGVRARGSARPRSHLFAVRLWTEELAGGSEYRGSAREVVSGAFRSQSGLRASQTGTDLFFVSAGSSTAPAAEVCFFSLAAMDGFVKEGEDGGALSAACR